MIAPEPTSAGTTAASSTSAATRRSSTSSSRAWPPRGAIVLAGFYSDRVSFAFPAAFMREARIRIAAEWSRDDLLAVNALAADGRLSFDGLITHRHDAMHAEAAYRTAFGDPACLKMILDWRNAQ